MARSHRYSIDIRENGGETGAPAPKLYPKTFYLDKYLEKFGKDAEVKSLIHTYKSLSKFPQQQLKVAVLYGTEALRTRSRILESILADPLAKDNKIWFDKVSQRSRTANNEFDYSETPEVAEHRFSVPAPILNQYTRPTFMNPGTNISLNGLSLVEINDMTQFSHWSDVHFAIIVIDDITATWKLPKAVANKILFTVIDNKDFTPHSTEAVDVVVGGRNHMIKIDSQLLFEGIEDFLVHDTKASNHYLRSLIESNIFQLVKTIGHNMQIEQLAQWYLDNIVASLGDSPTQAQLDRLYELVKFDQIKSFSMAVHSEFQKDFVPQTTRFFNRNLRWWRLYTLNDNVEYDIKDFFGTYFMPRSIENYNYSRGKIASQLQTEKYADYAASEFHNPLLDLKNDLIHTRITTEIQPVVTRSLMQGFVYYQLPISVLAAAAYGWLDFSANSAVALGTLGVVVGFSHVAKTWEKFTQQWLHDLFERVRVCIDRDCTEKGLLQELSVRYQEEQQLRAAKQQIVNGLKE